jgi:hypothetical protein
MSYSYAKPKPPCVCMQTLAASHEALAARYLAMLACGAAGLVRVEQLRTP